mmetsp:Transcript_21990/g.45185  ORF Transcript_21990/g.45185 Transcript_21990/m.45185 type:complete len:103 (+) Transcript_21990:1260-1568(+)
MVFFVWVVTKQDWKKLEEKKNEDRKGSGSGVCKKMAPQDVQHKSTRGGGKQGAIDCCPNHERDIQSLELDKNPSWITKNHTEQYFADKDGNLAKNLVHFFHS